MTGTLLFAGGGTGGHLIPGLGIAEALRGERDLRIVFAGAATGLEARVVPKHGWPFIPLDIQGIRGQREPLERSWRMTRAVAQACRKLGELRPRCVVGLGGFASAPWLAAAWMRRVPYVLLEQNTREGFSNRVFRARAQAVFHGFVTAPGDPRALVYGNALRGQPQAASRPEPPPFRVLVLGGSQGARFLNAELPKILAGCTLAGCEVPLQIRHQTGRGAGAGVEKAYTRLGVSAKVFEFDEAMHAHYRWAHLAIARAGALTIAELCAFGVPAVFVPYPFAASDHQLANAQFVAARGAGWIVDQRLPRPGARLQAMLEQVLSQPRTIADASLRAARLGRPHAAETIAAHLLSYCRR